MEKDIKSLIDKHKPKPPYEFLLDAWSCRLNWSINKKDIFDSFRETIDENNLSKEDIFELYLIWFNENIWGGMKDE